MLEDDLDAVYGRAFHRPLSLHRRVALIGRHERPGASASAASRCVTRTGQGVTDRATEPTACLPWSFNARGGDGYKTPWLPQGAAA